MEGIPVKSVMFIRTCIFDSHIYSALKSLQENNTMWPLPVKIFCRDEKGERVDVSKYLIKKGLALRETRYRLFLKNIL